MGRARDGEIIVSLDILLNTEGVPKLERLLQFWYTLFVYSILAVFSIDVQSQQMKLSFWENIEMTVNVTVNHPLVNGNVVVERFDGQGM